MSIRYIELIVPGNSPGEDQAFPLLDPGPLLAAAERNGTPTDFWRRANSYTCPRGQEPGSAWVVLDRATYQQLNRNGKFGLRFHDDDGPAPMRVVNLLMTRAICTALDGDGLAAYLVEFQDIRRLLQMSSIDAQYNVRRPAPPTKVIYISDTLPEPSDEDTDQTPWTWRQMFEDVWGLLPEIAGCAPTWPKVKNHAGDDVDYAPDGSPPDPDDDDDDGDGGDDGGDSEDPTPGVPQNWRFVGVSAWCAVFQILDYIGCTLGYDPTNSDRHQSSFKIIRYSDSSTIDDDLDDFSDYLLFDYQPATGLDRADLPEKIQVFFPCRNLQHFDEDGEPTQEAWEVFQDLVHGPIPQNHSERIDTGASGAEPGTVLPLWDKTLALLAQDGFTVTNADALAYRAAEIAANYQAAILAQRQRLRAHFAGTIGYAKIGHDSRVNEIVWRDYGDADGQVTEIKQVAGQIPCCPRPEPLVDLQKTWLFQATGDVYDYDAAIDDDTVRVALCKVAILGHDGSYTVADDDDGDADIDDPADHPDKFHLYDPRRIVAFAPDADSDTAEKAIAGDLFEATFNGNTGRWEIVSAPSMHWAVCTAHWDKSAGYPYTVKANPCPTGGAGDPDTDTEITIRIYAGEGVGSEGSDTRMPNVETGNTIAYRVENRELVCISRVLDGHTGDIRMTLDDAEAMQGWGVMDGFYNSIELGGSGVDARLRFPRFGSPDLGDESATTGGDSMLTVPDHVDHAHGVQGDISTSFYADPGLGPINFARDVVSVTTGVTDLGGGVNTDSLKHDAVDCRPAFVYLRFMERLDNSTDYYS